MAFQQHLTRYSKLVMNSLTEREKNLLQLGYQWGREDAAVEERAERERAIAGRMNKEMGIGAETGIGANVGEGQTT